LTGWVTIDNKSGATYPEPHLKLLAGDVRRVEPPTRFLSKKAAMAVEAPSPESFAEKEFFEYHLYTLGRPATVADNQTKQIELLSASEVPVKKVFLYQGNPGVRYYGSLQTADVYGNESSNKKVNVIVEFKNSKDNSMGMALPKGRVRLYKRDEADGGLEFIGEDTIDHTPKDETVILAVGDAFDVVGEHKRTDFKVDNNKRTMTESFEVRIRNHKKEDIEVVVKETLYRWNHWEIMDSNMKFKKYDAQTVHFPVKVPQDGQQIVTYTVRYNW